MIEDRHSKIAEKETSREFGRVVIGSGYKAGALQSDASQSQEHCALDWASVNVTPGRVEGKLVSNGPLSLHSSFLADNDADSVKGSAG